MFDLIYLYLWLGVAHDVEIQNSFSDTPIRQSQSFYQPEEEKINQIQLKSLKLTFKRRIKSHLQFAGIIRSSPYSPRFQENG